MEKMLSKIKSNIMVITAIVLMVVAVIIACQSYTYTKQGFIIPFVNFEIGRSSKEMTLMPNLLSTLFAVILYSGVVIRNKFEIFKNPLKIVLCIVNVLFLSTITGVFIAGDFKLPFVNINGYAILFFAIVMSWLGMKSISGYAWIILLVCSLGHMTRVSASMGFVGAIYILSSFISLGMQIASGYLSVDKEAFKRDFYNTGNAISVDINQSIETSKKVLGAASNLNPSISNHNNDIKESEK